MADVGMLDLEDMTLHLPGSVHLITKCGLTMNHCQVGASVILRNRARQLCTECFLQRPV